jgi:hypothetical protein
MGKTLNRNLDYAAPLKKHTLNNERVGEDYENIPKKEGQAHYDTWRYKRGFVSQKIIERMMKKHVGKDYNVLYAEIAKKYKTGSLERLHLERSIKYMERHEAPPYYGGYFIDKEGIIRYSQRVAGRVQIIK